MTGEVNIQVRPSHRLLPHGLAWDHDNDEAGRIIATTEPVVDVEPEPSPAGEGSTREVVGALVRLLTDGASPEKAGRMLHLLAYSLGMSEHGGLQDLADAWKVTPARLSQLIGEMPAPLRALCGPKTKGSNKQKSQ